MRSAAHAKRLNCAVDNARQPRQGACLATRMRWRPRSRAAEKQLADGGPSARWRHAHLAIWRSGTREARAFPGAELNARARMAPLLIPFASDGTFASKIYRLHRRHARTLASASSRLTVQGLCTRASLLLLRGRTRCWRLLCLLLLRRGRGVALRLRLPVQRGRRRRLAEVRKQLVVVRLARGLCVRWSGKPTVTQHSREP